MKPALRQTGTYLDRIVARVQAGLEAALAEPERELRQLAAAAPAPLDFAARLRGPRTAVIAEIKRASPSRGLLRAGLDAAALAREYAEAGAAGVSVLTEPHFFQGSLEDLAAARRAVDSRPGRPGLLRKDFLIHPRQLVEARAAGADAVLLIVAVLGQPALAELLAAVRALGMEALVEVHDEGELERALAAGATLLGINNRDLRTFEVDVATAERLAPLVPPGCTVVAESGIATPADVSRMARAGAHAVLVGEALLTAPSPGAKLRELLG